MGRTKRTVDTEESPAKDLDAKSKAIEKANKARLGREKAQKSYREPTDSENSDQEFGELKKGAVDRDFSEDEDPSEEDSGSDWDGQSSGSEYGKKKKKVVAKAGAKGKGRGRSAGRKSASVSPKKGKGRGRGRSAASASSAAKNGSKKAPAKRAREASEESESEAESSGSEYGKKKASPAKKATPARGRASAASKAKKSSPAPASESNSSRARRGRPAKTKSYKELSEDEELEVSEEEKKPVSKRAKLEETKTKAAPKKDKKKDEESEDADEDMKSEDDVDEKADVKAKKANGSAPKDEKKEEAASKKESKSEDDEDEDKEEDEKSGDERKSKEKSPVASEGGESTGTKSDDAAVLKNRTDTDYSKINLACDKKTPKGDEWNFKISTWNVGGVRSWLKKNGLEYLKKESPDVMCLNETKCDEKSKPEELAKIDGYPHTYWAYNTDSSGQAGVAIFSKLEPKSVQYGLPVGESDTADEKKDKENFNKEGRLITAEYENFYLINAYVPNSGKTEKTEEFPKGYPVKIINGLRLKFDKYFKTFIKNLEEKKPVIVTGDLNCAHQEIDLANPKTNDKSAGFTKEERDDFSALLKDVNLVDSFRVLYPEKKGAYTFWSYRFNCREKNVGWRLDYFLLSEKIRDSFCENAIRSDVYGSDHCPIVLFMKN